MTLQTDTIGYPECGLFLRKWVICGHLLIGVTLEVFMDGIPDTGDCMLDFTVVSTMDADISGKDMWVECGEMEVFIITLMLPTSIQQSFEMYM